MERQLNTIISNFLYSNNILPNRIKNISLIKENNKESIRLIELTNNKKFYISTINYNNKSLFGIKLNEKSNWFTYKIDEQYTKDFLSFINEAEPANDTKDDESIKQAENILKEQQYFTYLNNTLFPSLLKTLETNINSLLIFTETSNKNIVEFFAKNIGVKSKKTSITLPSGSDIFKEQIESPFLFEYNDIKFIAFPKLNYLEYTNNQPMKVVLISNDNFNKVLDLNQDELK